MTEQVWAVQDSDERDLLAIIESDVDDHPVVIQMDNRMVHLSLVEASEMASVLLEVTTKRLKSEVDHWKRVAEAATPPKTKRRGW